MFRHLRLITAAVALAGVLAACGSDGGNDDTASEDGDEAGLVVYAGRNENLIRPLLDEFAEQEDVDVDVRYGETSEMLATLEEEGDATRADVFISQDAGALAHLAAGDRLAPLPAEVIAVVPERFRDPQGRWVGVTGRVRVIAHNTDQVPANEVPESVFDLTDPKWKGKIGLAPTNASLIAFVSALREQHGEDRVRQWLDGLAANEAKTYDNNLLTLEAVATGEVALGLVNHYYLYNEFRERGTDVPVANFVPGQNNGEGTFVNISGVGVLAGTDSTDAAQRLVTFLLGEHAQEYFRTETAEYPMRDGVAALPELEPLADLETMPVPLSDLGADYEASTTLIKEAGLS